MKTLGLRPKREIKQLSPGETVWIFGAGGFGRSIARACLANGVQVQGFILTNPTVHTVDELPVYNWNELSPSHLQLPLLIGIYNRDTPLNRLVAFAKEHGFKDIMMPWDLHAQFSRELGWRYWLSEPKLLGNHAADLNRAQKLLHDQTSKECLKRVVNFRMGLDLEYAEFVHPESQYFNSITLPTLANKSVNYLDGGAYNGDTFNQALKCMQVQEAWLFEPDKANFYEMVKNVKSRTQNACCVPMALDDNYKMLRFSSGLGEAGHLDEKGEQAVAAVAIDEFLSGKKVNFIKLDIEGAEKSALRGAKMTLQKHRPVLALSCYHHPEDLWALLDLLNELISDYKFHLRQHMFNSFDLVLYAVPGENYEA
jgi:FkbM family methyltransferase